MTQRIGHKWGDEGSGVPETFLLSVKRHFRPVESTISKQADVGKNAVKDTLRNKSLRNKTSKTSGQEVKIIYLHELEITPEQKRTRKE